MGHDHTHVAAGDLAHNRKRLYAAIAIIGVFLLVEIVGAFLAGSLALLADAGHMASDLIALVVALLATVVAARPATDTQSFGYRRFEVLAALLNGLILVVVAIFVSIEAVSRLFDAAPAVDGTLLLIVASGGLVANAGAMLVLRSAARTSINMRGAYLEVLGDMLGSVAAVVAGIVIITTGFAAADSIASLAIAAMIVPRALVLLRDVVRVLSQATPRETDVGGIRAHIEGLDGVIGVHDVHVWEITSGHPVFSAHVVVADDVFLVGDAGRMLDRLTECLTGHFDVEHSTFQLETVEHANHEGDVHR